MTDWRLSIFGLITLFVVYYLQDGIVGFVRKALNMPRPTGAKRQRRGKRRAIAVSQDNAIATRAAAGPAAAPPGADAVRRPEGAEPGRPARRRGTIHGLIGPNGSGKSTMMNVLTGIYVPTAGAIEFGGSVVGRTSADIALSGIARTFQNVQLFGEMTALQNVLVGLHHSFRQQPARRHAAHAALPAREARRCSARWGC
jgi:hypothetical protein